MSVFIEIIVATFFALVFSKGEEVKPEVAEKAKTEKVCEIFSEEC